MGSVDTRVVERLDALIEQGEAVLATRWDPGSNWLGDDQIDAQRAMQWVTSVQSLIAQVFGEQSVHCKNLEKAKVEISYTPARQIQGIVLAAKDDYVGGYLFNVRKLVQAELFVDFLEQAEHLLESGYEGPAAVIAGSVLEDGLRKLCCASGITISDKPKMDGMNAELARAGVYSALRQKQITAFADLRNKAAHGNWDEFSTDDVRQMIQGIRTIMEAHFA